MEGMSGGRRPRRPRGTGETPVPVDPRLLERVLRSLEEESRLEADIAHAEMKLRLDAVNLRLR
jgi:hypothetical protein